MNNSYLVFSVLFCLALVIIITLIVRKHKKKANKNLLVSDPINCLQTCQKMHNNNPLCSRLCSNNIGSSLQQKFMIKCVNSGIDYGTCYTYLTEGDNDCVMYCYLTGCGDLPNCLSKCYNA